MANGSGADGSITIDTELDNSGFEKGSDKLLSALEGLQRSLDNISDTMSAGMDSVIKALQNLGSQAQSTARQTTSAAEQSESATKSAAQSAQQAAQATEQADTRQAQSAQSAAATQTQAANAAQRTASAQSTSYAQIEKSAQSLEEKIRSLAVSVAGGFKTEQQVMKFNDSVQSVSANLDDLKAKLEEVGSNTRVPTEEYAALTEQLKEAEAELLKLREEEGDLHDNYDIRLASYKAANPEDWYGEGFKDVIADLIKRETIASDKVDEIKAKMESLKDTGNAFNDSPEYQAAADRLNNVSNSLNDVKTNGQAASQSLHGLTQADYTSAITRGFQSGAQAAKNFVKQFANVNIKIFKGTMDGLAKVLSKIGGLCKSAAKGIARIATSSKSASNPVNSLIKGLTSFKTMLLTRIKRTFMSDIFSDLQNAVQKYASYDAAFNKSMSNIKNMGGTIAANIASLFGNIISFVEPIVTTILGWINQIIIAINSLFAFFTGKSTIKVANQQTGDYAKSLASASGGASKAAKAQKKFNNELYSYDELTRQSKQDDSSSSGGGASGGFSEPSWAEMDAWSPDEIRDKLKDFLKSIDWDSIQKEAYDLGAKFANMLNDVFKDLELADLLGTTIAEALNTALQFALGFLDTFDFAQFGKWAGTLWNAFVRAFDFQALGDVISKSVNGIFTALDSFFKTIYETCYQFGQGIGTVINSILVDIDLSLIAQTVIDAANDLNRTLEGLNDTIDWDGAAQNMIDGLNTLFNGMAFNDKGELVNVWEENGKQVGILIGNFVGYVNTVINGVDWTQFGHDIGAWFYNAISGIDPNDLAGVLTGLINGIVDVAGGIIEAINWEDLASRLTTFLNGVITGIDWEHAGEVIGELFANVLGTLNTVIDEVDWVALGEGIGTAMSGIDWGGVFETLSKVIFEAFGGMLKGLFSTSGGRSFLAVVAAIFGLKSAFSIGGNLLKISAKVILEKLIGQAVDGAVTGAGPTAAASIGGLFKNTILPALGTGAKTVLTTLGTGLSKVGGALASAAPTIGTAALGVADAVLVAYDTKTLVDTNNEYKSLAEERETATQTYCDNLAKIYEEGGQEALDAVTGTHMSLEEAQAQAEQDFADVPTNMWEGFEGGWNTYFGEDGTGLWGLVKDAFSGMVGSIKEFLGIASPSTVMEGIGDDTMQGLVNGISGFDILSTVMGLISPLPAAIIGVFTGIDWTQVSTAWSTAWDTIGGALQTVWDGLSTTASTVWDGITTTISTGWDTLSTGASTIWTGIQTTIDTVWNTLSTNASTVWNTIQTTIDTIWTTLSTNASTTWTTIQTTLTTTWETLRTTAETKFDAIKTHLETTWESVKTKVTTTWENIKTTIGTKWENIKTNVHTSVERVKTTMSEGWTSVKTTMDTKWGEIKTSLGTHLENLVGKIKGQLESWKTAGGNLVGGLLSGLKNKWEEVSRWVSEKASALTSKLQNAFKIGSPSKVWAQIGEYLDEGLLQGLQSGEGSLMNQTAALAQGMSDRLQGDGTIAMDGTVSGIDGVVSQLSSIANIFTGIAQTLASMGELVIPQIAAGSVVPARVAVASSGYETDGTMMDGEYLDDIRIGIQNLVELLSGSMSSSNSGQTVQIMIDGKAVFDAVVNENNRAITRTGRSPIRV